MQSSLEEVYKGASREVRLWPSSHGDEENYPLPSETAAFARHLWEEGFVVVRGALPAAVCDAGLNVFRTCLKTSRFPFLRHEIDICERHVFTEAGYMQLPILNVQDVPGLRFRRTRTVILDLYTHPAHQLVMRSAFGETAQLVQTMIFEGNQNTWPHRDGRYIDSQKKGELLGAIVAAENIHPGAGRFYICPRSNVTPIPGELYGPCSDPNSWAYKELISDFVINGPLECVAPILNRGDMLIWTSLTIHGSLATVEPRFSRTTFNSHWVPASKNLSLLGGLPRKARSTLVNGVRVARLGGQHSSLKSFKAAVKRWFPELVPKVRAARELFRQRR